MTSPATSPATLAVLATVYTSKREALAARDALRADGLAAKVFQHAAVYTVPGRGITSSVTYVVQLA